MALILLAYAAGVLTILSPCILPVLPFVLAGAGRPLRRGALPMLAGMAVAFAAAASLAAVAGHWAVRAHDWGRIAALTLLAVFALALLWPAWGDRLMRPLMRWGASPALRAAGPVGLGVATGLLWAPCAGPVLGLVLATAALNGPNVTTSLLLLSYAAGAASALGLALAAGRPVAVALRASPRAVPWLRRALGGAVLLGVSTIATGTDTRVLARLSAESTRWMEERLLAAWQAPQPASPAAEPFAGATAWLNSPALRQDALRGKVVLAHFWTYSCINCLRSLPYVRAWADKYRDAGLVVVGVHSPEFAFEKNLDNVRRAVRDLHIPYPVAIDSGHAIWRAFDNRAWPALYFLDAQGRVRHEVLGEGRYAESERLIQQLLAESGRTAHPEGLVEPRGTGALAPSSGRAWSGETYVGFARASNYVPPRGLVADRTHQYVPAATLPLNHWTLAGSWTIQSEQALAQRPHARLAYRFRARDLHLVLGREAGAAPVRFRVRIDGQPPGASHGNDVDAQGEGRIDAHRLYQLVRQPSAGERLFEIEFLDSGAQVYAFTFG
jgi:cytochrome c biogenesis protein CcdA/thiol-disulfide isomerase/thioredoxin